jgi:hypothetical protein
VPAALQQQDAANSLSAGTAEPPTLAAVEAGRAKIEKHLEYFKERLCKVCRPVEAGEPRILIEDWARLYRENEHEHGNHFVVHQHDHPVSGVHCKLKWLGACGAVQKFGCLVCC